jgi:hypothetical protein
VDIRMTWLLLRLAGCNIVTFSPRTGILKLPRSACIPIIEISPIAVHPRPFTGVAVPSTEFRRSMHATHCSTHFRFKVVRHREYLFLFWDFMKLEPSCRVGVGDAIHQPFREHLVRDYKSSGVTDDWFYMGPFVWSWIFCL